MKKVITNLVFVVAFLIGMNAKSNAQFIQQGPKLVGTGCVYSSGYPAWQGRSVSLSADGNTLIEGGANDDTSAGATWVFTRSAGIWSQLGNKLIGTGAIGESNQGQAVAISMDGNTAIVGGYYDSSGRGASWIFILSGGVWIQQGDKLVGTGEVGNAWQGYSVAISSDGNTVIVGGVNDNNSIGAAWIFTRSGGVWSQQGSKIVGSGAVGAAWQGFNVSISGDGNTAIVGGFYDSLAQGHTTGAAWIFTRSGGIWTQQGNKLVGTGAAGGASQGFSVALSYDGNTALVGGNSDSNGIGATWVFTRSGTTWTQQGNKLVGTGAVISANGEGTSVSLSYSGDTALIGGADDNGAWVFTRAGGAWSQFGNILVGTNGVDASQGWSVSISSDGSTAAVGGYIDSGIEGATWVYYNSSTGIKEIKNGQQTISLSPNPFTTTTTLTIQGTYHNNPSLFIYNLLGQEVRSIPVGNNQQITIPRNQLPSGMYFYKVIDENKEVLGIGKMVIE